MAKEIEQHEWGWHDDRDYGEDLAVRGLGPCTGIVVTCMKDGVAAGAHLADPLLVESEALEKFLQDVASRYPGGAGVVVIVSGCCSKDKKNFRKTRSHVESRIRAHLPNAQLNFKWPDGNVLAVDMTVDMESFEVDVSLTHEF